VVNISGMSTRLRREDMAPTSSFLEPSYVTRCNLLLRFGLRNRNHGFSVAAQVQTISPQPGQPVPYF
jgi:hypothetical protein